jgi:hypothetical protein
VIASSVASSLKTMVHFDSLRGRIERALPTLGLRLEGTDVENSEVGQRGSCL